MADTDVTETDDSNEVTHAPRRTGGPVPTAEDLSVLHLHDRHTGLGLVAEDLVGIYRTILTARVLDQKIWALNRMGKAAFVVSGQGHEGVQVGSAWALKAGHDIVLPYYRDTGVMLTLGMTVEQIRGIHDTVLRVLDVADAEGLTTAAAADLLAERRIDSARIDAARMTTSAGD